MKTVYTSLLIIIISIYSCCMGGYQVGQCSIEFSFPLSTTINYLELYPRIENSVNGKIPNYEKSDFGLKLNFSSMDLRKDLTYKIYLVHFSGQVFDSIENVKFESFQKDKCTDGMKSFFSYNGKFYPSSENQTIKY